jgi:hypothetical protein
MPPFLSVAESQRYINGKLYNERSAYLSLFIRIVCYFMLYKKLIFPYGEAASVTFAIS